MADGVADDVADGGTAVASEVAVTVAGGIAVAVSVGTARTAVDVRVGCGVHVSVFRIVAVAVHGTVAVDVGVDQVLLIRLSPHPANASAMHPSTADFQPRSAKVHPHIRIAVA